jgi:hypothetical protein
MEKWARREENGKRRSEWEREGTKKELKGGRGWEFRGRERGRGRGRGGERDERS